MNLLQKANGRVRLFFGFCPECNSSAPELDTCPVCDGYRSYSAQIWPPTKEVKDIWWKRFTTRNLKP